MFKGLMRLSGLFLKKFPASAQKAEKIPLKKLNKKLFCEEFWENKQQSALFKASNSESVSLHGYLNSINHHFHISPYPDKMDEVSVFTNMTPREMITKTDFEFKSLMPLGQDMKVFRGIGEKPDFFSTYKLYQKALNIKKGETIRMSEYAYATSDINYANGYLLDGRGIMYEIEIPKGAKVSRIGNIGVSDEIVFPRCSEFKCTAVSQIKDAENDFKLVKLKYLNKK